MSSTITLFVHMLGQIKSIASRTQQTKCLLTGDPIGRAQNFNFAPNATHLKSNLKTINASAQNEFSIFINKFKLEKYSRFSIVDDACEIWTLQV